jgi:hypothetical protein
MKTFRRGMGMVSGLVPGLVSGLVVGLVVSGCATHYGPGDLRPGQAEADVIARLGTPTSRYALPDGAQRLEFARGPFGKHTYMVDLAADGRVRALAQVLREDRFNQVQPGMSADDLRLLLGRPGEVAGIWRGASVWSWRYETPFCQWFSATVEPDGTVRDAGYPPDPLCEVHDKLFEPR